MSSHQRAGSDILLRLTFSWEILQFVRMVLLCLRETRGTRFAETMEKEAWQPAWLLSSHKWKKTQKDNLATTRLSFLTIEYWHHYTWLNSSLTFSVISISIGKWDEDSDGILIQFWISLYVDEDGALGRLHEESEELFCGGLYYESHSFTQALL